MERRLAESEYRRGRLTDTADDRLPEHDGEYKHERGSVSSTTSWRRYVQFHDRTVEQVHLNDELEIVNTLYLVVSAIGYLFANHFNDCTSHKGAAC